MRKLSSDVEAWRIEERRKERRFRLILRVGVLEQQDKLSLCLVKNISSTGIQVRFYTRPIVGAEASIRMADEESVRGYIVWAKGDIAGMSFGEELDTTRLLRVQQKLCQNRRRNMPRVSVEATATLRAGGQLSRALVCDISNLGARIRTSSSLNAGDRAVVEFADLPSIPAYVRWSDGEESGLSFETPIPMQIIAHWIEGRPGLSA
jgi:hypothetical protein